MKKDQHKFIFKILKIAFFVILAIIILRVLILDSMMDNLREDLNFTRQKTERIVELVELEIYTPAEGIVKVKEIEKEVNYMEIKGNKVLDFYISNNSVDEMLHPMWVRNAETYIYFARLDIGAIVIRRAGLEITPELVQDVLSELDQEIGYWN